MKFTVVVPTRERCETLGATLRTCLEQDHPGLTVVVSDNASTDETRAVVESFADPRVRYVNTGRRVSMARNWEFALGAVDDDENYVHYLGDDDGLLPGALRDAETLLAREGARALAWRKVDYVWPNGPDPAWRNLAIVPLENRLFRYDASAALRDVRNLWLPYYRCPSLYNSFVDARLLHATRRRGGTFFHSSIPDAYSGYANLSEIPSYLYSTRPFSINGASGKSTGASYGAAGGAGERFVAEDDMPAHPKLWPIPGSIIMAVMEALYQANDHALGGRLAMFRPMIVAQFFREVAGVEPARWEALVGRLEAAAAHDDAALARTVRACRRLFPNRP
ncbi:MAG: hypothetical protein JWM10_1074, partial [Myxococcaceae bacterium]|nr:hypothetical protein [Myxococcaceae bacterium]